MKKIITLLITVIIAMAFSGCATSRYYKLPAAEFDDIDYGFPVKKVQVRNINVAVIDQGSGEKTVMLIHGLGTNAKGWIKNIPVLAKSYRVIAVDLPGYGKSDKGYYQYSMDFYAQVLTELLTNLGVEKATLIGHSMGGQIAMTAALNNPDKVENLVLISPAGFERFAEGEGDWMRKAVSAEFVKNTTTRSVDVNLKANFYETPEDVDFMITDRIQIKGASDFDDYCYAVSKNVGAMLDGIVWDRLDKVMQPTLIMFGENDGLIPNPYLHGGKTIDVAKIGDSEIPNSKLIMIPKCGHFVQFEKSEAANKAILEFLSDK